jgi:putative ABC transport system permease protein
MKDLSADIRFALRLFGRHPGFTASIVLTLALGIGVNSAIFSAVYGVLLRPLPYTEGDHLLHLGQLPPAPDMENVTFSVPELRDLTSQSRALSDVAEYHSMSFTLLGKGEPDQVNIGVVSASFFELFGVQPLLGRTFSPEDEAHGSEPVLVLTHEYWRRRFGGDPGIVGQSLRLNDRPITIVGVLPPLPQYPGDDDDAYMPTVACPTRSSERVIHSRRARMLTAFARLSPGTTLESAQSELATLSSRMRQENAADYDPQDHTGIPVLSVREELVGNFRPLLLILLGVVGLLLLVACANVANLILARLASREQELGLRAAFGAGRGRLTRLLLTESTLLSLAGGALGLLLAASCIRSLAAFASRFTPRNGEIGIDPMVLLFTTGLALITGLLVGVAPALRTSPRRLASTLREGGAKSTSTQARLRLRGVMVVLQVAVSFVLLVGAGLLLRTFFNLQQVNPGFDSAGVAVMQIPLQPNRYPLPPQRLDFFDRLFDSLRGVPGVQSVAVASDVPLSDDPFTQEVRVEGAPMDELEPPRASLHIVSDDYFRTLGIPLLQGRSFGTADRGPALPVALVSRAMALRSWPAGSPLGKRFVIPAMGPDQWWTVVGVVGDVKQYGLNAEGGPAVYLPFAQMPGGGEVFVRTASNPERLFSEFRSVVRAIDPDQPVVDVRTLAQVQTEWVAPSRLTAVLVSLFAVLAAAIAVLGIGSLMTFTVAERTQEIGIRAALGATPGEIQNLILRQALPLLAAGLALGALTSLWLTRLLAGLLFGVAPNNPATLAAVAAAFTIVFVLSALVPARRAARIDPLLALKK